jgi:dolichol-phosphate mannosyltransferase
MVKTIVVLPTYNEAENLPQMVREIFSLGIEGLEIIVVDDNSPDGTGEIAEELASCHPDRLWVIHRQGKLGLGSACLRGFEEALARGADYVVEMDSDFSHSPSYLPLFLEKMNSCHLVIGSRYVEGGRADERWSIWRRLLSRGGNLYARLVTGLSVRDTTSGFRCYRREVLENLPPIGSEGYAFQIEMAYLCQKRGYRLCELPIYFEERALGRSKMSLAIILEAFWRVWQMRWRHRGVRSP